MGDICLADGSPVVTVQSKLLFQSDVSLFAGEGD